LNFGCGLLVGRPRDFGRRVQAGQAAKRSADQRRPIPDFARDTREILCEALDLIVSAW
jgi:hypothetical protein